MRVDCVGVRVRWRMYGVGMCVAAKVRMIPLPILYCHSKVFLFGTPQTHPGKLVFDQFSSTADPLFGRSKILSRKLLNYVFINLGMYYVSQVNIIKNMSYIIISG